MRRRSNRRVIAIAAVALSAAAFVRADGAEAAGTQVIRTATATGWIGGNEGPSGSIGSVAFVPGPAPTPLGTGSARLIVDSTGRASLGTVQFAGTRLDQITALSYQGYVVGGTTNQLVLAFDVDYDLTDANTAYQGRLTWVPPTPAPADTWTTFDAFAGGGFFATGAPGNTVCTQASLCTISQILTSFPDAGVRSTQGAFLIRLGGPIAGGATAYIDDVHFASTGDGLTIADFEAGVVVSPPFGGAGDSVTIEAHNVRPGARIAARYDTQIPGKGRRVLICTAFADAQGVALCTGNIPAVAGNPGVHQISVRGKATVGRLNTNADFLLVALPE